MVNLLVWLSLLDYSLIFYVVLDDIHDSVNNNFLASLPFFVDISILSRLTMNILSQLSKCLAQSNHDTDAERLHHFHRHSFTVVEIFA